MKKVSFVVALLLKYLCKNRVRMLEQSIFLKIQTRDTIFRMYINIIIHDEYMNININNEAVFIFNLCLFLLT